MPDPISPRESDKSSDLSDKTLSMSSSASSPSGSYKTAQSSDSFAVSSSDSSYKTAEEGDSSDTNLSPRARYDKYIEQKEKKDGGNKKPPKYPPNTNLQKGLADSRGIGFGNKGARK